MLDSITKSKIDTARQILVGKVPDPKSQIEQITLAMIYKFMDDADKNSQRIGGKATFFVGDYKPFAWENLLDLKLSGDKRMNLYMEGLEKMSQNPNPPEFFRSIFKNAYLPFRDPITLKMFLEEMNGFEYDHSERLGDAYEYLLSIMSSQGDAGQFRTPRHIIDFIVSVVDPQKEDSILDPACGTAGFLISAIKHIYKQNTEDQDGDLLTFVEKENLANNVVGYDISADMVKISLVNMFLHQIVQPHIYEYDTLSYQDKWDDNYSCILANPPFMSPKGGIQPHNRFSINSRRSEALFVDYIMDHLTTEGKGGVVVPEGIIFQTQNAYKELRKKMVESQFLWAVVSLPSGVFNPYSGVKTSILFFDKQIANKTDKVLFVKVDADGFNLGAQRRPIKKNDLPEVYKNLMYFKDHFAELPPEKRKQYKGDTYLAHTATKEEIKEQEYILSANRYLTPEIRPSKWPIVKLGEIVELNPKKNDLMNQQNGFDVSFLPMNDLQPGKLTVTPSKIRPLKEVFKGYTFFSENDVLMAKITPCFENGKIAIAKNLLNGIGFGSTEFHVIRSKNNKILPSIVYYLLSNRCFREYAINRMTGSAGQKRVPLQVLSSYQVPLPPIEIQKEIVEEIEGYQRIIDGARLVIDNWKPTINIDPIWPLVMLGEVMNIYNGTTPRRSEPLFWTKGNIPWFTIEDIRVQGRFINYTRQKVTEEALNNTSLKLLPKNSILLCCTASIGEYAYTNIELTTNQQFNGLVVKKDYTNVLNPRYAFWYMGNISKELEMLSNKSTFSYISVNTLKSLLIPLPPIEVQEEIVEEIESIRETIDANQHLVKVYEEKINNLIDKLWKEV